MKPLLNLDEPVQRRTGELAEIIKRDALGSFPVVALLTNKLGTAQFSQSFTLRGSVSSDEIENWNDLINVPKSKRVFKFHRWITVDEEGNTYTFSNRLPVPSGGWTAVREVILEITEGEGL